MINLEKYRLTPEQQQQELRTIDLEKYRLQPDKTPEQISAEKFKPTFPSKTITERGLTPFISEPARLVGNIPSSAYQFGKGIATFPLKTAQAITQIPSEIRGLAKETGGLLPALTETIKQIPRGIYEVMVPELIKNIISGNFEEAQRTLVNDPFGQIAPIILTAKAVASKMGVEKQFDIAMEKSSLPIMRPLEQATGFLKEKAINTANKLEEINLRLTPVQKSNLGNKIKEVVNYNIKNKISGDPETRYNKINLKYEQSEKTLQNFLETNNTARGIFVSKSLLLNQLEKLKSKFRNERDVLVIEKQIDGIKNTFNVKYREKIPIARLNEFKRSTYKNAFNKSGDKVLDSVEYEAGDLFKTSIENSTKGLKIGGKTIEDFNKEYGTIITARKLLKIAKGRPQLGFMGKIISSIIGGGIGTAISGPLGTAIGAPVGLAMGEALAGTPTRGAMARILTGLEKAKIPQLKFRR